jgi:hypothetical protein
VLTAQGEAAFPQSGEESPHRERGRLGHLSQQAAKPPGVVLEGDLGAAADALAQQERLDSLREGVNPCFFSGFREGLNG